MMSCDWAEKVSLLVDGELAAAEAAAVESHLVGCADCRAARGEFLFFRQQLGSSPADANPSAQRRALAAILASKAASPRASAPRAGGELAAAGGWRERLAAALGVSGLRPAAVASLALVVLAVGLAIYVNSRDEARTVVQTPAANVGGERAAASTSPTPAGSAPAAAPSPDEGNKSERLNVRRETAAAAGGGPPRQRRRARPQTPRPPMPNETQTVAARAEPPRGSPPGAHAPVGVEGASPASARALDTSRHVEQAQLLLRSFRNARATDDLAYERERSQRLLYRNIVLRREAASKGDPVVAGVLDRLEPILIDIANLPDKPASADVDTIRERVRKKNLVVALQAGVVKYK